MWGLLSPVRSLVSIRALPKYISYMWGPHHLRTLFEELFARKMSELLKKTRLLVEIYKSFRPGDIVLAKVISLGDAQSNYLLTTAENELGVVVAHSEAGVQMVPISWCEMQCPKTHTKEFRKVARVQPEFLQT
ncbi:exosome complex component CSL4 isoform X2 [Rousettus aegyptiacus]|uniref:Exosome component 1 n=1 Tax=Rousettus aegyptiacus TaxID=9407 RepID=A0A7J8G7J5_ROUAE|nr:exosome complex component CSL4 isoform X2 [Rousettus aegyptiacus]KAF6455930.1 exosome component 1 [Rousettus aegyptiacus]